MKKLLDWQKREVVNHYDDVSLWSAPFGRLLLENIPMKDIKKVVDLGFGTGFPLIELAQRFGNNTQIIGVDVWKEAIQKTREKIELLELENILILEQSAEDLVIERNSVDLVCSNLGVNNFRNRHIVYQKVQEALNVNGHFCLTTNDNQTFSELFELFRVLFKRFDWNYKPLDEYLKSRSTVEQAIKEIEATGLKLKQHKRDETCMRFTNAEAVIDHGFIRIAFLNGWNELIKKDHQEKFYQELQSLINQVIQNKGEFQMQIPIHYLKFVKQR